MVERFKCKGSNNVKNDQHVSIISYFHWQFPVCHTMDNRLVACFKRKSIEIEKNKEVNDSG